MSWERAIQVGELASAKVLRQGHIGWILKSKILKRH